MLELLHHWSPDHTHPAKISPSVLLSQLFKPHSYVLIAIHTHAQHQFALADHVMMLVT